MIKKEKKLLKQLCSHIINNLRCHCGLKYGENFNEPCACGWTNIEDMFEDDFGIEFKMYELELKEWYRENYGINL